MSLCMVVSRCACVIYDDGGGVEMLYVVSCSMRYWQSRHETVGRGRPANADASPLHPASLLHDADADAAVAVAVAAV